MKVETRLQSAGLRATPKRIAIGGLLFDGMDRHVTADDVAIMARKNGVRVSLATVYNTLNQFKAAEATRRYTGFGYSLVHLPDYGTTAATAVSGVVWSYLYFRYRRLLPLALSHALLGCAFYYWVCGQNLAPEWTLTTPGLPQK